MWFPHFPKSGYVVLTGFVFVCFTNFSLAGFAPYIRSFWLITMKTVSVNVLFVLLVEIWIPSLLALLWDLCCAHHLFVFMALPSLCLTGIVSITSMIAFPCLFTFEVFDRQVLFCLWPFIQLWFVPLQQAWKSVWMSCVLFTLWWGRGEVLDVWAGWSFWTICFQCGY